MAFLRLKYRLDYSIKCAILVAASIAIGGCNQVSLQTLLEEVAPPTVTAISPPNNVLFIGNSFTYFNNGVDSHLHQLVRNAYPDRIVYIDSLTVPNETVQGHYENRKTIEVINRVTWDLVVIQGASYEPAEQRSQQPFYKYSNLLANSIRKRDIDVAFFMTWAYRSRPSMIGELASEYVKTGNKLSALVVPVGLAWETVRQNRAVDFLYSDGRHPSMHGTYLAACVFFAAIYGESPVGNSYQATLSIADARFLQQIAWKTTTQFYGQADRE